MYKDKETQNYLYSLALIKKKKKKLENKIKMTKINSDKENSTAVSQTASESATAKITRKTKQIKKNFLTLNKNAVASKIKSNDQEKSNRRLSLNTSELLKLASTNTSSNRRKSLSNPFTTNDSCSEKLKRFKSKIDYLKVETLTSYDKNLKQMKTEFDNDKEKTVS